jgi:hypothetical protein
MRSAANQSAYLDLIDSYIGFGVSKGCYIAAVEAEDSGKVGLLLTSCCPAAVTGQ